MSDQGEGTVALENSQNELSEKQSPNVEADGEEMDDLFGDDSDQETGSGPGEQEPHSPNSANEEEDDEQAMYNRKFYGDKGEDSNDEGSQEFREADIDIMKHIVPYSTEPSQGDKTIYYTKVPQFLTIDPIPFDPPAFQSKIEERAAQRTSVEDQIDDRLIEENTVRWRYSRDKNQRVFKESNAHIVQWSDGTYSLRLGDEYTDVLINDTEDTYLAVSHDQQELIQSVKGGEVTKNMIFIPTSTNSKSHQRLSKAVARKEQQEHHGPNTYILRVDPELEQKELEKKQGQIIRERRKRQLREQQEREGMDSPAPTSKPRSASRPGYSQTRYDEYEDDGFMVDDEENESDGGVGGDGNEDEEDLLDDEEEEDDDDLNAERLRQLKRKGAAQYNTQEASDNNVESDDAEDSAMKRRKVAVLDDEDDE
ncbi:Paf1-complex subunit LEO1 [Lachancea thermotolerans CBS 6340]|uniref:KLTH0F15928p n=1 Tax=Lachancea thermotolerans (strain ATCC 56472 / CBS 6340 / NRRL Y-8284) TaxID=559295 RepID=C5DJF2_LACTC|nr:KLTH0F15928p [Lachancea thermotolerans CBS 6340]CAR24441.1 KLTH0F15928p [Lachancea thermotolerans CBS 6340]